MKKALIFIFLIGSSLVSQPLFSQEKKTVKDRLEVLEKQKEQLVTSEKEALKAEVVAINKKHSQGLISFEEAEKQKREAAELHALNIDNKLAIIENSIALLIRENGNELIDEENLSTQLVLNYKGEDKGIKISTHKNREKEDVRTNSDLIIAFGLNNAIFENESLNDSPYKTGKSRFFEIGWAWSTRVFEDTNAVRFKYGFAFQYNGLSPKNNQYFVELGDQTVLEEFPMDLKKSKFRMTNLVFPVHFEFGPSKKIQNEHNFRYSTHNKFKFGVGGFAGFNLANLQKLKYSDNGDRIKEKNRNDFNTVDFVYGLSAYVGKGDTSLYIKYDLNPVFNNALIEQNNISLGVRFDL